MEDIQFVTVRIGEEQKERKKERTNERNYMMEI